MEKMKMYTFYSESHRDIYEDYFLKSFKKNKLDENFELITKVVPQLSDNGGFNSKGFNETMNFKLDLLLEAVKENKDKYFMYCDCDVQFIHNFYQDIISYQNENIDIYAQPDEHTICAGFFMAKSNIIFEKFIKKVQKKLKEINYQYNDQVIMNQLKSFIRFKLLPKEKYFSIGNYNGGKVWKIGDEIKKTEEILVHHANYTIGTETKKALMNGLKNY